jgi:hypothetical protein
MARYSVTIRFTIALRRRQKLGVNGFIKSGKAINSSGGNLSGKSTLIAPAGEPLPIALDTFRWLLRWFYGMALK